ncbi:MAG TPA: hypothetical protein PK341_10250 [Spirochaetota bacterium]|nr:hypothetical protein [Spirochaetota bacterium]
MKKYLMYSFISIIILSGCGYYRIKNITKPNIDLNNYNKIYASWLDLGEDKWAVYRYSTEKEWLDLINAVNRSVVPSYFKEVFEDKTVISAKNPGENPPSDCLIISFENANYNNSDEELFVTIIIIDGKTSRTLAKATVYIDARKGGGFQVWSFEQKINNSIHNLTYFIRDKIFKQ